MKRFVSDFAKPRDCEKCAERDRVLNAHLEADESELKAWVTFVFPHGDPRGSACIGWPMAEHVAVKAAYILSHIVPDIKIGALNTNLDLVGPEFGNHAGPDLGRYRISTPEAGLVSTSDDIDEARVRVHGLAALTGESEWRIYDSVENDEVPIGYYETPRQARKRRRTGKKKTRNDRKR
ncbi:MAG: hypothetical protein A3K19_29675 [Lentisphaerae bacterium RIFOXYB12_FULL_65_16]|nr:MAG: hypothetical protein A3K18_33285 [Lentisphaerae bacterium RIFOXYA12_64_32]OGV86498.1 MAG: hypothetical protein A3K19_29675 [Lentisphaerae bacterium RIFOXYB12_FULL_65_16]